MDVFSLRLHLLTRAPLLSPNLVVELRAIAFGLAEAINIGIANVVVESDF